MIYAVRLICVLIGYCFGLFQTAYIYGRIKGFDLKNTGSGNYGTTNMLRSKGLKAGLLVLLGDSFKCVFAVLAVWLIFGKSYSDIFPLLKVYTAAGVILGHNFPFYMGFRGGKGIAATAGLIMVMGWTFMIPELIIFALVFGISHYVSLGSLTIYLWLFAQIVIMGEMGYGQFASMTRPALIEMYVVVLLLVIMAFVKHRENISRLLSGTERKTYLTKKKESDS